MDVQTVLLMVWVGLSNGSGFGEDRARAMENLPRRKVLLREANLLPLEANVLMFAPIAVLTLVIFLGSPQLSTILSLGSMGLAFLVGYGISATLSFVATKRSAKKRPST